MSMKIDLKSKLSAPTPKEAFNMMLGGTSQKDIRELEISSLIPYPNQPFRPYSEEKLTELAEDIKENGVLSPLIVRPVAGGYQILSGHRRVSACKLIGLTAVPCIIKVLDDSSAKAFVIDQNMQQRS